MSAEDGGVAALQGDAAQAAAGGGVNHWKTWQSDEDIPHRKVLIQHM